MCFLSLGVADEAHKVETNTHALFVDYKNVFENQYHLDVVNFCCCCCCCCCHAFMGCNVHTPAAKKERDKSFQLRTKGTGLEIECQYTSQE